MHQAARVLTERPSIRVRCSLQRWATTRSNSILNLVGVIMSASCGLLDMASFSFAAQSLLAPFGALTLVINLLLAAPLHGDAVGRSDLLSTALVFSGVACEDCARLTDPISHALQPPTSAGWPRVTSLLAC